MKWIGQHIYDLVSRFREDVYIEKSDLYIYDPTTNGNPSFRMGVNATETFQIRSYYQSGTQSMQLAQFVTKTESGTANDGRFQFFPDDVKVLSIDDGGIDFEANFGISIDGTDIITDSSGTATLSNIDALDATTIATFEAALEANIDTLTLDTLTIDKDRSAAQGNEGDETITALHVDFDRTVPTSGTGAHVDTGIDLDVTSASLGTSSLYGMDIDVVGATSGTSTAYGIHLDVDGADTNIGMVINTAGTHLKLEANTDADDYATFTVANTGDLTIATVGDGSIDSDLTLDADGQIKLEPAAGKNILLDGTIAVDAGVVTGATSITSTAFVGDLTGNADTATTAATVTGGTQAAITSAANLATVGTIGTGVWEGSAIATGAQKHLATFDIRGYSTADGTNYEIPVFITDNQAPFEHNTSAGSDGLTALAVTKLMKATGIVMPYAGTLKKWKGWATHSTTAGTCNVALFRYRPNASSDSAVSLVLLDAVSHTPAANNTVIAIDETSFTDADVAAGDVVISGIKGSASQVTYFVSTLEVEWD